MLVSMKLTLIGENMKAIGKSLIKICGRIISIPFVLVMFFVLLFYAVLAGDKAANKLEKHIVNIADFLSSEGKYEW